MAREFFTAYNISDRWAIGFTKGKLGIVVVFGDKSYDFDEMNGIKCQITSGQYYADDIMNHNGKLCLDLGIPSWTISAEDVEKAKKFIHLVNMFDWEAA